MDEDREKEIARMLAGDDNSYEALEHARSLLVNKPERCGIGMTGWDSSY